MKCYSYISGFICCLVCTAGSAQIPVSNAQPPSATPIAAPPAYTNSKVNYLRTRMPMRPMTDSTNVANATDIKDVLQSTEYFDGLGRLLQKVDRGASPLNKKDIVTPVLYDAFGRQQYKYLPYVASSGDGEFRLNPFNEQAVFFQSQYPNENIYYNESRFELSALNKIVKELSPGNSWGGSDRGGTYEQQVNTLSDSIRIWNVYDWIDSYDIYPAGRLTKHIVTDENGNKVIEYINKEGKTILKKVQVATNPGPAHVGWLCTYNLYDNLGNLRLVLPPLAVEKLLSNGWNLSDENFRKELCFSYEYDHRNRMIVKGTPGAECVEMVYDARNRLVFLQDGNMRSLEGQVGKWLTTLYDELNRPIMTGFYTTTKTRAQLQLLLNEGTQSQTIQYTLPAPINLIINYHDDRPLYTARESIEFIDGFDSGSNEMVAELNSNATITESTVINNYLPAVNPEDIEPLTFTYYDNYDFPGRKSARTTLFNKLPVNAIEYPDPIIVSKLTIGKETGKKVRILDTNEWLTTTIYYDDKGRVIQELSDNFNDGEEIVTNQYAFSGKLLGSHRYHSNPKSSLTPELEMLTKLTYNDAGQILSVVKQLDNGVPRTISFKTYNAIGQVIKNEFKGANGNTIESVGLDYNIRGWISGINKKHVNDEEVHYFGEEISYDYGFTLSQFNGNISGIKWKGAANSNIRAYGYGYDKANRLLNADFNQQNSGSTAWSKDLMDFSVSNLSYDPNGNILSMNQKGVKNNAIVNMDQLNYSYYSNSNKLQSVAEQNPSSVYELDDFRDRNQGIDYIYDKNGNLLQDLNKGITSIEYNYLNQPSKIFFGEKGSITFLYDALGRKCEKIVTDKSGSSQKVIVNDYMKEFTYINDSLKFISHEEGRIRPIYKVNAPVTYVYDYFLKDHLGNIRSVLTEQTDLNVYLATLEPESAAIENALFNNIDNSRSLRPIGYPQDQKVQNEYVAKLNGNDPNKRIGPSLVLKVMAGDTITIGAKAFYKSSGLPQNRKLVPIEDMASALLRTFGSSRGTVTDAHTGINNQNNPFSSQFLNDYGRLREREPDDLDKVKGPKAYLNYVFFDDQMNLVNGNSGAKRVKQEADQLQTLVRDRMVTEKSGFLYVYTSNESDQDVYFDDVVVQHIPGRLIEENHYYPFGLMMNGISSRALSKLENKFLYNGKEFNSKEFADGFGLDWYDYGMREYDPKIGRFFRIDPLANDFRYLTPYQYAGNEPIKNIDLDGLEPQSTVESWDPRTLHSHTYESTGQTVYYIDGYWVSMQTGMYNGVYQYYNKDEKQWREFNPVTQEDVNRSRADGLIGASNLIGSVFSTLFATGAMVLTGGAGVALTTNSVAGGAADAGVQYAMSNESTASEKLMKINLTSVLSSVLVKNPALGAVLGSGLEYSVGDGYNNSLFGNKTMDKFVIESVTGTAAGHMAGAGSNYLGLDTYTYSELKFMSNGIASKVQVLSIRAGANGLTNAQINLINSLTNGLFDTGVEKREREKNEQESNH